MRKRFYFAYNIYRFEFPRISITFSDELGIPVDMHGDINSVDIQLQLHAELQQFIGEPNSEHLRNRIRHTLNASCLGVNIEDLNIE